MEQREWIEAARRYSKMSTAERAQYWEQLTPEQRASLQAALERNSGTGRKRGCGGPLVAGCGGMILGVILTIGAEVALVMMGVQAVVDSLEGFSTAGANQAPAAGPNDLDGVNLEDVNPYELLQYCGTEWEERYEKIAYVCWENEVNERINERVYRERAEQD